MASVEKKSLALDLKNYLITSKSFIERAALTRFFRRVQNGKQNQSLGRGVVFCLILRWKFPIFFEDFPDKHEVISEAFRFEGENLRI